MALTALCGSALAQTDGITVTVSRNVDLPPDAIYFSLAVITEMDASLEDVLAASQSLGLTAQSLSSVTLQQYGPSLGQTRLAYAFNLAVAYGKFKETTEKLSATRRTMAAATPPMELQVFGIALSPGETARDEARLRLLTPLFDDARKRGDELARAAGATLGPVLGATESWANTGSYLAYLPYGGPIGPTTLKTAFFLTVRYSLK